MFVKKDGTVLQFCSSKCDKNMLELKRAPRKVTWITKKKKQNAK